MDVPSRTVGAEDGWNMNTVGRPRRCGHEGVNVVRRCAYQSSIEFYPGYPAVTGLRGQQQSTPLAQPSPRRPTRPGAQPAAAECVGWATSALGDHIDYRASVWATNESATTVEPVHVQADCRRSRLTKSPSLDDYEISDVGGIVPAETRGRRTWRGRPDDRPSRQ